MPRTRTLLRIVALLALAAFNVAAPSASAKDDVGCKQCDFCNSAGHTIHCCWSNLESGSTECNAPNSESCTESGAPCRVTG